MLSANIDNYDEAALDDVVARSDVLRAFRFLRAPMSDVRTFSLDMVVRREIKQRGGDWQARTFVMIRSRMFTSRTVLLHPHDVTMRLLPLALPLALDLAAGRHRNARRRTLIIECASASRGMGAR